MSLLPRRHRIVPADHSAFAGLAVEMITTTRPQVRAAVHRRGDFSKGLPPLVCLAGYHRNMADFTDLAAGLSRPKGSDWPMVLIDLPGRGRADDRKKSEDYNSLNDSADLANVLAALGIGRCILVGQGHGGQVAMLFASQHPLLVAGTVLIDSGPVTDSRGIVRLRSNMAHIESWRSPKGLMQGFRRILSGDYPELSEVALDALALRSHWADKKGRAQPLFDKALIQRLEHFNFDDILVPQWPLFEALKCAPLMILRTQLTDQLRRETYEEMVRRRPDAVALTISGQGSPALFDQSEEIEAVQEFVTRCSSSRTPKKSSGGRVSRPAA